MKTYLSGTEAVEGKDVFKELTVAAENFSNAPETPKRFPKKGFELPTLVAMKDCQNS